MASAPYSNEFVEIDLGSSVRLHVNSTAAFQRTSIAVFFASRLELERVAATGLLPKVLRRGNTEWPTAMALERELDSLYGARLSAGAQKTGDHHIVWFTLNMPGDRHLEAPVFSRGMRVLKAAMFSPVVEDDGLQRDYVEQEKQLQVGRIRALINNKSNYAVHRCVYEMFPDEPFRTYELGTEDAVRQLTPQALLAAHAEMVRVAPMDIYVVGDVRADEMVRQLSALAPSDRAPAPLNKTVISPGSGAARTVVDEEVMGQGWLVLGYRSDVAYADPRYAMQFLNGVLGGFVHSKLFINVREKASLAYQASSGYNPNKGYLLALAGIDPAKHDEALAIMLKQVEDIRQGAVSVEEMEATRSRLLARIRLAQDDATSRMMRHLAGTIEGVQESIDDAQRRIAAVTKEDVVVAAQRLRLDTIYFLKGVKQSS